MSRPGSAGRRARRASASCSRTARAPGASGDAAPEARLDVAAIARAMVGADLPAAPAAVAPAADARSVLELSGVSVGSELRGIDLAVRAGEIVGVAGVDGNGQRE